jgi:uncharacterized OB-fold protein
VSVTDFDVPDFDLATWRRGRTLPEPSRLSRPFWEGLAEGRLMVQRCAECDQHVFRPEEACIRCLATALEWVPSSGTGVVYAHSVVYRAPHPDVVVPFVVACVEVDSAWHLMTNVVGCAPEDVYGGLPVRLRVERIDDLHLPLFEPDRERR